MLTYHPAIDPYHASFRMLTLLSRLESPGVTFEKLRILDFYHVFPSAIQTMRFPQEMREWRRRVRVHANPYHATGNPAIIFQQMRPAQESGFRLLLSQGLCIIENPQSKSSVITTGSLPIQIEELIASSSQTIEWLLEFLVAHLASIPLAGPTGLKARTGLLEARYDSV